MLSALSDWVTEVIDALGYVGVALLIALENLFPPIPSEIVLPFAGFVASDRGGFALIGMIIAATVGSLVGAWILYGLSAWIGRERLRRFLLRYGKWLRLTTDDVDRAEAWFDRRAVVAVLVGRCDPLLFIESVPLAETRGYLKKVLANLWAYQARAGGTAPSLKALAENRWPEVGPAPAPPPRPKAKPAAKATVSARAD